MKLLKRLLLLLVCFISVISCDKAKSGSEDEPVIPPEEGFNGTVTLIASKTQIESDGIDVCKFTVKADDKDVTSQAEVYMGSSTTPINPKEFKSTEVGSYEFYAKYKEKSSEKIKITVAKKAEVGEVVIMPSKSQIKANGNDVCSFTVTVDGNDVTEKSKVYVDGSSDPIEPKEFKSTTVGTYEFYAEYESKKSDKIKVEVIEDDFTGTVTLSANKTSIVANGDDTCSFSISANGNDVTKDAELFILNSTDPMSAKSFSSQEEAGTYKFYAMYKGVKSNEVSLQTTENTATVTELILPKDPMPENLSFERKVMALQFTGVGCVNCPPFKKVIKDLKEGYKETADRFVLATVHSYRPTNELVTELTLRIKENQGVSLFPDMTCNLKKQTVGSGRNSTSALKDFIERNYKETAGKVGISAVVIKEDGGLKMKVAVKSKTSGNYRIGAFLLEDGVRAEQTGAKTDADNIHYDVIRSYIGNGTDFSGDAVLGRIGRGETKTLELSFGSDCFATDYKIDNCKVLIYVTEAATGYTSTNAIVCKIGQQVKFRYK